MRNWLLVFIGVAIMAWAAALVASMNWPSAVQFGPLSGWIAAVATFSAAYIALKNAKRAHDDAVLRDQLNRDALLAREQARIEDADRRYRRALLTLSRRFKVALEIYWKKDIESNPEYLWSASELRFMKHSLRLPLLTDALSRIPLHQAPDEKTISAVELMYLSASICERKFEDIAEKVKLAPDDRFAIDLSSQLETVTKAWGYLKD